jgi:dTDP-4-amino-4,6-dideoxygalactose transaminase
MKNMATILDNQWLTNNRPMVQELERRIEEYLGIKHCICVCNATIGLELLQRVLDLTGEVMNNNMVYSLKVLLDNLHNR